MTQDFGDIVFTKRWSNGVKALTFVTCAYTLGACLLADWDALFGPNHVFSGIRPAVRSHLNKVYGTAGGPQEGSGSHGSSDASAASGR